MTYKAAFRLITARAAEHEQTIRHLHTKSALTHKPHYYDIPVYVYQISQFYGKLSHLDKPTSRLWLNLYGSKPTPHIYRDDSAAPLRSHQYLLTHASPDIYKTENLGENIIIAVKIDESLITASSDEPINRPKFILLLRY